MMHRSRRQVQSGHPDGQPGLFQRRHAAVRRDDLERRNRQRHRSARLDRPSDLAAGPDRDSRRRPRCPIRSTGISGSAAAQPRPYTQGGEGYPQQFRREFLPSVQLARLLRLRLRRAGRHGLPHPGRAEYGAEAGRAHQRGVHQEGRRQRASCSPRARPSGSSFRPAATCRR